MTSRNLTVTFHESKLLILANIAIQSWNRKLCYRKKWTIFNGWTKWKSWKFSFSRNARVHGSRHRASDCCHATPWCQLPRTALARGAWMTRQHTEDRQLYNRTFPTSRAHRGSLSKRRELVLSSLPTRPPLFSPSLGPQSLTLRVSFPGICSHLYVWYVQSHHFPWLQPHELQSIRSPRLTAIRTHHPISHVSLGEAHSRLPHTVFPPKGLLLSGQGGCSADHIRGKGSVPVVPLGRKLVWQPVLSRAPKDPHLAV